MADIFPWADSPLSFHFLENVFNYNFATTFSKFIQGGLVFIQEIVYRKSKEKFYATNLRRNVHACPVRARDLLVKKNSRCRDSREKL